MGDTQVMPKLFGEERFGKGHFSLLELCEEYNIAHKTLSLTDVLDDNTFDDDDEDDGGDNGQDKEVDIDYEIEKQVMEMVDGNRGEARQ